MFRKTIRYAQSLIADNKWALLMVGIACVAFAALTVAVIYPAYKDSNNGMYSSKLGQPSLLRKTGKALPVVVEEAKVQKIERHIMGEGLCASRPVLAPIIPMALVQEIHVEEGQEVEAGQLLASLDASKAKIKYESAKLAVSTAEAELERVRLGSAYVLAQERPEVEKINLAAMQEQRSFAKEKLDRFESAHEKGVISKIALLEARKEFTQVAEKLSQATLSMQMAERGVLQSLKIAENALGDAKQALAHRQEELKAYQIYSPASGVIDRVLIQPGEYNQDSGKPGFLIASGLWFEAFFDQSDFPHVKAGLETVVSLESYPGVDFKGKITRVKPVVSFNSGGPEISRPLRPRGSGSPEWAATFKVQIDFTDAEVVKSVVTGMTGFTRMTKTSQSLTVPRASVMSISAGSGVVYLVDGDSDWRMQSVKVGHVGLKDVEIFDGIQAGDRVMVDGHWSLNADDQIEVHHR